MKNKIIILTVLTCINALPMSAQSSGCESLLAQGVFDTFQQSASNSSSYSLHQALCMGTIQQSAGGGNSGGGASIVIPGTTIPLGLNFSDAQNFQNTYKSTFCQNNNVSSIDDNQLGVFQMVADPSIISGYKACVDERKKGFQSDYTVTPDRKVVTFQVSFIAPVEHAPNPKVLQVSILPKDGATCTGIGVGALLNANQSTLICSRNNVNATTITISTTAGNIQAYLEAIPRPPTLTATIMKAFPKGMILSWTDLANIPNGWHLADGTNGTVNLVGRVPMGVDDKHPEGEADEGSTSHSHTFKNGQTTDQAPDPGRGWRLDPNFGGGQGSAQPAGGKFGLSGVTTDTFSTLPPVTRVYFIEKIT